jgi:hypothetical protein
MPNPLRMIHDVDPKQELLEATTEAMTSIEPLGASVLLAMYKRPDRLVSGLYIPNKTQDEDKYQGKVGLVVKLGPIAFREDSTHQWGDRIPHPGDWVIINIGDAFSFDLPNDRRARIVEDVHIKAITRQPDLVW